MIGRGYLYALAAYGQPGVTRALSRLRDEVERDLVLMGCSTPAALSRDAVRVFQGSP
jgi:L-lactate dehydrogenase (cytochrome)